mmetsp:Transcript_16610/g.41818  ORF Transcript_16610/g.41818 Transcript_16610/m.41818 type:complete len:122 (+) Transcript_16610:2-367(+)
MAMDWGATGVPLRSMAFPAGGSVSAAPMFEAPAVYSCPPEIFAKLAAGGALTAVEMAQLTGQAPLAPAVLEVPAVAEAVAEAVTSAPAAVAAAVISAKASKKKSSKKDSLKTSKKSKKGCC